MSLGWLTESAYQPRIPTKIRGVQDASVKTTIYRCTKVFKVLIYMYVVESMHYPSNLLLFPERAGVRVQASFLGFYLGLGPLTDIIYIFFFFGLCMIGHGTEKCTL